MNETNSLQFTVEKIFTLAQDHVHELLIITSPYTIHESKKAAKKLNQRHPNKIRIHQQKLPGLGGALMNAFDYATGNHVMLMASDLETDPQLIPSFIEKKQEKNWDIICGSRWIKPGSFRGYGNIKTALNWLFQKFVSSLYKVQLTDMTFGYRLYRAEILEDIKWQEFKHPFLLECLLKPLKKGASITEIPCNWQKRQEGTSNNSFWQMFRYTFLALRIRFM